MKNKQFCIMFYLVAHSVSRSRRENCAYHTIEYVLVYNKL